jgi:NitT/TauT family transport system substrate-binding protein
MRSTIVFFTGMIAATISTIWASAATAETLKVAVAQRGFWNSSFIEFALQQGFFKQEGLDIEILYTEGGASTLTPVIAGSIDIAMTNGTLGAIAAFSWLAALEHSGDTVRRPYPRTPPLKNGG